MPPTDPEKQRAFALDVVRKLRERGFESYWAGGCVRDQLLGRLPKDFDVATAAEPEEIRETFRARKTLAIGATFGVIVVVGPRGAGQIDVATFRRDLAYTDGRRPDAVEFSTPQADAERRDFTINGLFYDPLADRVIDFVDGQADLARRMIRAIGDPAARFAEDKLRLLRAVRFAATFDFSLDHDTQAAIEKMAAQITVVSAERIAAEMRSMLVHESRAQAMELLRELGLLAAIVPELTATDQHEFAAAWRHTLDVLGRLVEPTFSLALAALLHVLVDGPSAEQICQRWKLSNHELYRTRWLIENRRTLLGARQLPWPKLQRLLIAEGIGELLALAEAIAQASGGDTGDVEHCRKLLELPPEELNPPPLLTGDDLIEHGVPRGKEYQRLLEAVRDAQLEKTIRDKKEALALVDRLRSSGEDTSTP